MAQIVTAIFVLYKKVTLFNALIALIVFVIDRATFEMEYTDIVFCNTIFAMEI